MSEWLFSADNTQARSEAGQIDIPILTFRESLAFDVLNAAGNGGIMASDSAPFADAINAATDGCQRIGWAAGNVSQAVCQFSFPHHFDATKDLTLHTVIASGGTTDAVGFTVDSFFDEGDTKIVDTSGTVQVTTFADKTTTIASEDIPSAPDKMTIGLTPITHGTDIMYLNAVWLDHARTQDGVEFYRSDQYACRIIVPYLHRLVSAFMLTQNVVTTGTVTASLRQTDIGNSRGGALVGDKLENADLTPDGTVTNTSSKYEFMLGSDDKSVSPAFRQYFLILSATNDADRIGEPLLALEVEKE